jgi:serine/threonine-protein kinase
VDKVIEQSPRAGSNVAGQTAVTVTIGQKAQTARIPADIIGMRQDDAKSRLEALGLKVSITQSDSGGIEDTVTDTNPNAGRDVPLGSTVTLSVSKGNGDGNQNGNGMPDVVGRSANDAREILRDAGFRSSNIKFERRTVNDASQADRVVDQSIPANSGIDRDSEVTLFVGDYRG